MADVTCDARAPDAAAPVAAASDAPAPRDGTSLRWYHMAVVSLVVALARWWFNNDRHIFHVAPDEPSQLAVARWLSGNNRWNMFDHATWQSGLGVLITPFYWFTSDGETVVRLALALNALIGGLAAAVLAVLLGRLTAAAAWPAAGIALVVAVAPSSMSASSFVWAEPLVTLLFVSTTLLTIRHFDTSSTAYGVAAIVAAGLGYASHSRLLPAVGTAALVLIVPALTGRRWRVASVFGATTAVMLAITGAWTRYVLSQVWEDPSNQNTVGSVWMRAKQPIDVAESFLGQLWYQLAATIGATIIGSWIVLRSLRRPRQDDASNATDTDTDADRIDPIAARVVAVLTAPMIVLSATFMADRPRSDQLIYGRYNDAVIWPLVALGLWWGCRRVRLGFTRHQLTMAGVTALMLVASGAAIDALHGDAIAESFGVRSMISGLLAHIDADNSLIVWRATLVPLGLIAVIVATAVLTSRLRDRARWLVAIVAVGAVATLAYGIHRTDRVMDERLNGWQRSSVVVEVDQLVPDGVPIGVRTVPTRDDPAVRFTTQRQRYHVYQFYLPERTFVRDRGATDDVGPYVFAPLRTEDLVANGARLLWRDPNVAIGLFEERPAVD